MNAPWRFEFNKERLLLAHCSIGVMVTIKEATRSAMDFAVNALGDQRTVDMRLEEVDSWTIEMKEFWVITLSMRNSATAMGATDLATQLYL